MSVFNSIGGRIQLWYALLLAVVVMFLMSSRYEVERKTRLLEFGRFAANNRRKRGEGKPPTFNFLGFTHICGLPDRQTCMNHYLGYPTYPIC